MKRRTPVAWLACLGVAMAAMQAAGEEVLFADSMRRVDVTLTRDGVAVDSAVSTDGDGSLKIEATKARTVRLFEIDDPDVEQARLVYRARVRTRDVDGKVFLEMWCRVPGKGEYFARGLHDPMSGTTDWVTQETEFLLQAGQNPDLIKLNVVVEGKGTVWVDEVQLLKTPLP